MIADTTELPTAPDPDQEVDVWESNAVAVSPESDNGSLLLLVAFLGAILAVGFLRSWWIPGIIGGLLFVLFMHELAHFVTARLSGMKVTEFFLGFGPKIWSFNKGETEYGIKAIPAGAYVRIMGMTNLDDIDPAEEHRTYRAQPYWQRMMTICAGSAMHFLLATIALFVLFVSFSYNGFNGPPWFVNQVVPGSTAASLGIQEGDQILSINGDGFDNWDEFGEVVSELPEGPVEVVISRDGDTLRLDGELGLRPEDVVRIGFGLLLLDENPSAALEAAFVWPTDPADEFGLRPGDVLLRAGGVETPNESTMAAMLRERQGETITIDVVRNGEEVSLSGPVRLNTPDAIRGFFGVGPVFVPKDEPGIAASASRAVSDFGTIAKMNIEGIVDLVTPSSEPKLSPEQAERVAPRSRPGGSSSAAPSGDTNRPLSIVGIGRLIAGSDGVDQVVFMFAVVNIFVGLFNLAPVLPVDGGHAVIATYERARELVTRKPHRVDAAKLVPITYVVVLGLIVLGVWTFALDVFAWPA